LPCQFSERRESQGSSDFGRAFFICNLSNGFESHWRARNSWSLMATRRIIMITTTVRIKENLFPVVNQPDAQAGLILMRITFGIMFVWVFFENLRKSLYTATGYAISSTITLRMATPRGVEKCYGFGCSACFHGRTASGGNRNFSWCAVGGRPFYSPGGTRFVHTSRAYGFRSGVRRGYGSCWFQ
jgi:hypothetical protein